MIAPDYKHPTFKAASVTFTDIQNLEDHIEIKI